MTLDEPMLPWPVDTASAHDDRPRVGLVVVNWNTRGLLARLLFSVLRVLPSETLDEIVVVDNGSNDGSPELVGALRDAGLVHFIPNALQRYHGPGLTQGVNLLSQLARDGRPVDLVWALDSDVFVLRPEVIEDASAAMRAAGAVLVAEADDYGGGPPRVTTDRLGMNSTLFDPTTVWQVRHRPFLEDGEPSRHMQADLVWDGHPIMAFPFCHDAYLLHVGRATRNRVVELDDTDNRYYASAVNQRVPHYGLHPDGPELAQSFELRFRDAVPNDDTATIVRALTHA